jgi:hypothetical protein
MTVEDVSRRLSAGLDRDEQLARAAKHPDWDANFEGAVWDSAGWVADVGGDLNEHVANFDPARAVRQTAALRRILERHRPIPAVPQGVIRIGGSLKSTDLACAGCGWKGNGFGQTPWPCPDVQDLASIYTDEATETGDR